MGPLGSGPRCGTDGLDQYKTPDMPGFIRAQRERARTRTKRAFMASLSNNAHKYHKQLLPGYL